MVFTSSKDTLHPNLIKYLVDNNICKIKKEERNKNKGWCYLENNQGDRINISKQISNYKDLSDNLIADFKNSSVKDYKIYNSINDLGQKTLADTMQNINNLLSNEIK